MNIILNVRHVDPTSIPIDWALVTVPMEGGPGHYAARMDDIAQAIREMVADPARTLELAVAGDN